MQQNVEFKILRKHKQSIVQENNKECVTLVFHAAAIKFCLPGYKAIWLVLYCRGFEGSWCLHNDRRAQEQQYASENRLHDTGTENEWLQQQKSVDYISQEKLCSS